MRESRRGLLGLLCILVFAFFQTKRNTEDSTVARVYCIYCYLIVLVVIFSFCCERPCFRASGPPLKIQNRLLIKHFEFFEVKSFYVTAAVTLNSLLALVTLPAIFLQTTSTVVP